jgi:hypothetical protein
LVGLRIVKDEKEKREKNVKVDVKVGSVFGKGNYNYSFGNINVKIINE